MLGVGRGVMQTFTNAGRRSISSPLKTDTAGRQIARCALRSSCTISCPSTLSPRALR